MELQEEKNIQIGRVNKKLSDQNWLLNHQKKKLAETYGQLNESKEKLKFSNDIKDKFFNIVAQDLIKPFRELKSLASDIYGRVDSISRKEAQICVKKLKSNADNLEVLISNLLQWSKAQTESIEYKPETVDLKNIIDEAIVGIKPKANEKTIKIKSSISESFFVFAAPNMVAICINNLLSNAVKFTAEGGNINLNIRDIGNYYEIEVKDTGIGISNEDLPKLFRADIHFSTLGTVKEKGSGLGLTICKEFIKLNGGRIWAESEPELGTSFKFTLSKVIDE
jgi:signal transduction histidine kinase